MNAGTEISWESMMQAEDPSGHAMGRPGAARTTMSRQGAVNGPLPLAVRREEAARLLGIGIDSLDAHVIPEVRTIRLGRMVLVPVDELRGWIDERASLVGADW